MSLAGHLQTSIVSLRNPFTAGLALAVVLAWVPVFAAGGDLDDCAQTLHRPPSPSTQSSLQLLDPLNIDAWLAEKRQLTASRLRLRSLEQSHLWLKTAMERLVHSKASGPEKIEAFSRFVAEIGETTAALQAAARAKARKWRSIELQRWTCQRFDVGAGVSAFVGDSGRVLEFRPNGDIYRAILQKYGAEGPLSPHFRPPYSEDGTPWLVPEGPHLGERRILLPREAP